MLKELALLIKKLALLIKKVYNECRVHVQLAKGLVDSGKFFVEIGWVKGIRGGLVRDKRERGLFRD